MWLKGIYGRSQCRTTSFSARRDKIGVTVIGLKSFIVTGETTLGTGVTIPISQIE